jgi:glycosyltransferase involved in cell wall biosynthesis
MENSLLPGAMRVVFWGTYDKGKPRTRILLRGLRETNVDLLEIHADVWAGVEDKGHITGIWRKLGLLLHWLASYPGLIWRYLRAPAHDAVIVGYMGHLDVLVLWPFAKLRGVPVIWDAFLSIYNTVVEDRRILAPSNPLAWLLFAWEWLACRSVRTVVLDTRAHGEYFSDRFGLRRENLSSVLVGAETESFPPASGHEAGSGPLTVLFYGQFIPLHGIDTIVRAAQAAARTKDGEAIRWVIIGGGQEKERIHSLIGEAPAAIELIPWVAFETLHEHIARADICLGIFGDTAKAARVIPNKVFQVVSAGAPLITRESPAIRELLSADMPGIRLVPPADPEALLEAVRELRDELPGLPPRPLHRGVAKRLTPGMLGAEWLSVVRGAVER